MSISVRHLGQLERSAMHCRRIDGKIIQEFIGNYASVRLFDRLLT